MTWTKTSDDFPDRMFDRSSDAYRLHHAATTYSNRVGTDGHIAKSRLSQLAVPPRVRRPAVVRELVACGLWEESGDGWDLTDFFEGQWSREEVELNRKYAAIRQRKRFAEDPEAKAAISQEEKEVLAQLHGAREARRAHQSQRVGRDSGRIASQRDSQSESQRPDPPRPAPPLGEGEGETSMRVSTPPAWRGGNGYDPKDPVFREYLARFGRGDETDDVSLRQAWRWFVQDQRASLP